MHSLPWLFSTTWLLQAHKDDKIHRSCKHLANIFTCIEIRSFCSSYSGMMSVFASGFFCVYYVQPRQAICQSEHPNKSATVLSVDMCLNVSKMWKTLSTAIFLTWLLIGRRFCCQPIKSQVGKFLLTNMDSDIDNFYSLTLAPVIITTDCTRNILYQGFQNVCICYWISFDLYVKLQLSCRLDLLVSLY